MVISERFNIVDNENMKLDLEYTDELVILHIPYIRKMTKTVLLEIRKKVMEIAEFVSTLGKSFWAAVPKEDSTTIKLANSLGFTYVADSGELDVFIYGEV